MAAIYGPTSLWSQCGSGLSTFADSPPQERPSTIQRDADLFCARFLGPNRRGHFIAGGLLFLRCNLRRRACEVQIVLVIEIIESRTRTKIELPACLIIYD